MTASARAVLAVLLGSCLAGCQPMLDASAPPADIDRQCDPKVGCPGPLLCVQLFRQYQQVDGGISERSSHTCHPPCTGDSDCPPGYRCFRPAILGSQKVCIHEQVMTGTDG
jgi:hypothetical protein